MDFVRDWAVEGWRKDAENWIQQNWKEERDLLHSKIGMLENKVNAQENIIQTLRDELNEAKSNRLEEGEIQPCMMEELITIKEQVKIIEEEGKKKANWVEVITKTQEKVGAAEKWVRVLHVRVTGLKETNNVENDVTSLMSMMGVEKSTHTKAWRVGKKNEGTGESSKSKDRALILRFSSLEEKKEFLKKRPTLKKTGIFLGDDLTLSQLAHMNEVMPEIRAAREKGKMAFYRDGRVVIVERRST